MRYRLLVALGLPCVVAAQDPRPLGRPVAEFPEAFTRVSTLRELQDGRVLVVDERESRLALIDFTTGTAKHVGRTGAGPGEYALAGRIVALPGDSSVMHDPRNVRYLLIKPDGTPGETFRLAEPVWFSLGGRGAVPRASDARGYMYFEGPPMTTGRGEGVQRLALDSAPIMRYDRRTTKLDTLAWVQLSKGNVVVTPTSLTVGAQAFPARDDWVTLADGSIAVVRVRDYHIDRYSATGVRTSGPALTVSPVAVNEAEKQAWRDERLGRAVSRTTGTIATTIREPEWPVAKPPFEYWHTFARPNGDVWVLRSHKAAEAPVYDVFGASGALSARVALPLRSRLVGFGNGMVYLVRRDDDDLEHLQKYRLP